MQVSLSKLPSALVAGIVGAIVGFVCVAIANLMFFASSGAVDPSLVASLVPLALGFFLIVGIVVALANGMLWFFLVRKKGKGAIPWMLLSLAGAFAVPWIALLGIIFIRSAPSMKLPKTNELFCCCGVPGAIIGLLFFAFWLSHSWARQVNGGKEKSVSLPHNRAQTATTATIKAKNGNRKGVVSFSLGVIISTLTAGIIAFLFGIAIFFILQAEANTPPSGGGFPIDMSGLDTAIYIWLSLIASGIITLGVSLALTFIFVAPGMSTMAAKIINPLLFTLLSLILNLSLDAVIFMILYIKFHPI